MARTNKHDAHKDWILQRLQASPNVSQLVRDLAVERGVKTTDTEVRAWLKTLQRQRARSAAFAALIPDSAGPPGASVQILDSLVHTLRTVADLASVSTQRIDVDVKQSRKSKAKKAELSQESTGNPVSASSTVKSTSLEIPPRSAFPPPSEPGRLAKDVVLPPISSESIEAQSAPMGDFLSRLESSLTKKTTKKGL